MRRAEFDAVIFDESLPHQAKILYMYLRYHMDWSTGVVGVVRRISYKSIAEHLAYVPARRSHDVPYKPSNDQIKRLINKLVDRQVIVRLHDCRIGRENMRFLLPLALVRPDEERQMSATGRAPQENSATMPVSGGMGANRAPRDERHTSYISINKRDKSLLEREGVDVEILCPQTAIVELWNQVFPERSVSASTWRFCRTSEASLRARWREMLKTKNANNEYRYTDQETGLQWWKGFFEYCKKSDHLNSHNNFDLTWLVKSDNFYKVNNGSYHRNFAST